MGGREEGVDEWWEGEFSRDDGEELKGKGKGGRRRVADRFFPFLISLPIRSWKFFGWRLQTVVFN